MAGRKEFPLAVIIEAVDKLSGPMKRVAGSVRHLQSVSGAAKNTLRDLGSMLGNRMGLPAFRAGLTRANQQFGVFKENMRGVLRTGALVTGVLAGIGAASYGLVNNFTKTGDESVKTADRLGIAVERLQEWRFAADRSGIEQSVFNNALKDFNKRIGEAVAGVGETPKVLQALGVSVEDATGQIRSMDDLLPEIADKISKIESASVRAAVAGRIFGEEGGAKLDNFLRLGSSGMAEMARRANELGLVIGEDAARGAEGFQDAMTDLRASLSGVRNTIGTALLPEMTKLIGRLTELVIEYRPQIKAFAERFAEKLPERLERIGSAMANVGAVLGPLLGMLAWLADNTVVLNGLLAAFGAIIAGKTVMAIMALVGAVKTLGMAIMLTPVGWIIAGVAALAGAAFILYKNWDKILGWWNKKWDGVRQAFSDGIVNGLFKLVKEFNPFTLLMESGNALVKYLTGIDLGAMIANQLPDWARKLIGIEPEQVPANAAEQVGQRAAANAQQNVKVQVDFSNMPKGIGINTDASRGVDYDVSQGFMMMAP